MAKIRKIKERELIGGTSNTEVYPITHARAVYDKNNTPLSDTLEFLNTEIVWNNSGTLSNMNDFVAVGIYDIRGERTKSNDNLPILNANPGHSFHARLTVLDSSIGGSGEDDDKCITQVLSFSNRLGQGEVYIRTGKGSSLDNLTWDNWSTLQRNVNVEKVDSLDDLKDNGIYSGVWVQEHYDSDPLTFVCVVINDYFIGTAPRRVSQFVYGLSKFDGSVVYQSRVWDDSKDKWGDWEIINQKEISSMINDAIKGVIADAPETFDTLREIADWIDNDKTGAVALANAISANIKAINTEITRAKEAEEKIDKRIDNIPLATTENSGLMSAEDKVKVNSFFDYVNTIEDKHFDVSSLSVGNANTYNVGTTVSFGKLENWRNGTYRCKEGQLIKINTQGNTGVVRPFAFCDKDLTILQTSGKDTGDGMLNGEFIAPKGTEYIVVNCKAEYVDNFSLEIIGHIADIAHRYEDREGSIDDILQNFTTYTGTALTRDNLAVGTFYRGDVGAVIEKGENYQALSIVLKAKNVNKFFLRSNGTDTAAPAIFADANNKVVAKSAKNVNEILSVPDDAEYIYINAYPDTANENFELRVNFIPLATAEHNGLMSAEDKRKVDLIIPFIEDTNYTSASLLVGNANNYNVGTEVTYGTLTDWRTGTFYCKAGQIVKIDTQATTGSVIPLAFCDKDMVILQTTGTNDGILKGEFVAPIGTEYIVVNCKEEYEDNFVLKVQSKIIDTISRYNSREEDIDEIIKNLGVYAGKILTIDDLDVGTFYKGEVGEQIEKKSNSQARSLCLKADRLNNIKIKSNSTAAAAPIIYTDVNGVIIEKSEASVDGIYNIPENAVQVHITAYPNTNNVDFSLCVNVEDAPYTNAKLFPIPSTIYAIKGLEKSIYLSAITNGNDYAPYYTMDVYRGADCNYDGRRFFVTPSSISKIGVMLKAINNCGETIGKKSQYIQIVDNAVTSTKRILCIGDSITEGRAEGDMQTNVPYHIKNGLDKYVIGASNVIFVGSKGDPVRHEGWWGKTYQWLAGDKEETDISPFINPNTRLIDITYYKTEKCGLTSSDTIDIVSLAMGYNGTDTKDNADQAFASMIKLMNALREDNPNTKFIVQLVTYPPVGIMAHGAWMSISAKKQSHEYYRELCLNTFDNGQDSNVIVGDWGIGIDREYAYVTEEKQVSPYFDDKINIITDSAHPTYKGAIQLAENILGCLVYAMQL